MNLSMKWLADYVDVNVPIKDYCHALTMSGSKVEGYEIEGENISKVVVGKILSKGPHENADALFVCQVEVGADAPIQIVTNAKNVKEGDIVPVALDGATLPEGKIKKGKLRGVESFGMFCGLDTLGLAINDFPYADPEGVLVIEEECEIGQDIHDALGLNDTSVEFEITSNRPDCLSVIGLARETAATYNLPLTVKEPKFEGIEGDINEMLKVDIHNTEKCQRYCAGIVKNVKIGPSPRWMRERLRASGVRPINNFVDITNYVMLEYGQPMHAFDLRYVEGGHINVRNAVNGEKIMTLDGVERELTEDMLVIADEKKPVAVAGVMGGEYSGIMEDTTVVFESAYFEPSQVRRTSKNLKLKSDASSRYEKGVDRLISMTCLKRAFELVEELGAGEVVKSVIDCDYTDKTPACVDFDSAWINEFLGTEIPETDMIDYLNRLGFEVKDGKVYAPSFRIDIECRADIAEEVARIYGYNNIPSTDFRGVAKAEFTEEQKFVRTLRNTSASLGGYEIATYSFVSPKYFDKIRLPEDSKLRKVVRIVNPLGEDTSVMRTTTIPSMLDVLSFNYNNRNEKACLFEISKEYIPVDEKRNYEGDEAILVNSGKLRHEYEYQLPDEFQRLTIGMYGGEADFYTLKGMIEQIFAEINIDDVEYIRANDCDIFDEKSALHPGRSAVIVKDGKYLGIMGEVHPEVQENYKLGVKTYVAKLNIPEMLELSCDEISYKPLPKFPASTRDLSVIVDDEVPVAELEKAIRGAVGKILEKVTLFDVYKGKQIEEGKKSVSYSISMRSHEGTLTDEQADGAMKKALKALAEIGAELRM